jgi:predicted HTH transcriptional regulator
MALSHSPGNLALLNGVFPKSSSPQRPQDKMEIISAVFADSVIIEGSGKLVASTIKKGFPDSG